MFYYSKGLGRASTRAARYPVTERELCISRDPKVHSREARLQSIEHRAPSTKTTTLLLHKLPCDQHTSPSTRDIFQITPDHTQVLQTLSDHTSASRAATHFLSSHTLPRMSRQPPTLLLSAWTPCDLNSPHFPLSAVALTRKLYAKLGKPHVS